MVTIGPLKGYVLVIKILIMAGFGWERGNLAMKSSYISQIFLFLHLSSCNNHRSFEEGQRIVI